MGNKEKLLENAQHDSIPAGVWRNHITEGPSNYDLVPYRRGLYGGTNLDQLELYGQRVSATFYPWLMEVRLKKECREPGAFTSRKEDPRYEDWQISHINDILAVAAQCLEPAPRACRELLTGFQDLGGPENECDKLMSQYLADVGARVVLDEAFPNSWYLRDRDCIASIAADPGTVLKALADAGWSYGDRWYKNRKGGPAYGLAFFLMLSSALADAEKVDESVLSKIQERGQKSDIILSDRDVSSADERWIAAAVPELLTHYRSCLKAGRVAKYRREESIFRAKVHAWN